MALTLPIYKRNNTFVLHLRVEGKQIKRSLGTLEPSLAKVRAMQLLGMLLSQAGALAPPSAKAWNAAPALTPSVSMMGLDPSSAEFAVSDQGWGLALSQETQTLQVITPIEPQAIARRTHELPTFFAPKKALVDAENYKLARIFGQYIEVRKIKDVTKLDYGIYAKEITPFFKNKDIRLLTEADVNALINHLRIELKNDARTVDNKVGFLRAVINYLIKQGVFFGANPASAKNLVSKRERRQSGTKPIAYNDLKSIFGDERFAKMRHKKPAIYLIVMVGLVTGMRVSSVARLQAIDLKVSMSGTHYVESVVTKRSLAIATSQFLRLCLTH